MERRGDTEALRLASNGAAEKIHLGPLPVTNIVQHRRRMIGLRANLVHLPRILVQLHAKRRRNALAVLNQVVQKAAELAEGLFFSKMARMRQLRERGNGMDRAM